jgi:SAM-dependent methyltransferase
MVTETSGDLALDDARRAALAEWEAMAPGWERRREFLRDFSQGVTDWLVARLDPKPGQTILELASGTGDTGFAAARVLGKLGRLISTDLAPGMVEVAKRRAEELGVSNAEFRVLDATATGLETGTVDGILCRWGYSLVPDAAAAFAESRRVLRRGGRLALSVMAGPAENPWASAVAGSLIGLGLIPPIDPKAPGGLFSLADHDDLRAYLTGAGFVDVRIEDMGFRLRFADFGDYWRFILEFAGAVAILLQGFSEEQRSAVRDATEQGVEPFRTDDGGYDFPGLTVNAVAS